MIWGVGEGGGVGGWAGEMRRNEKTQKSQGDKQNNNFLLAIQCPFSLTTYFRYYIIHFRVSLNGLTVIYIYIYV